MKTTLSALVIFAALVAPASATEILQIPLLNVDYQAAPSPVETGFQGLTTPGSPTIFGAITVTHTNQQGNFDRNSLVDAGAFTYADLYNDFVYNNGGNFQVKLSGLNVSSNYQLRLYVYDNDGGGPITVTNTFTPISGTLGAPGVVVYTQGVVPTTNTQYSTLVTWTSNISGEIEFNVSADYNRRFSGFELVQLQFVPEPSTLALLSVGVIGMAVRTRRRRRAAA